MVLEYQVRRELGGYYPTDELPIKEDDENYKKIEDKKYFFICLSSAIQKKEWRKMKLAETKALSKQGGN